MNNDEANITRIAMWSGPRNISTAMMRAWENRADTAVVDEPFYACFLTATGIVHPMQAEVLAHQSSVWQDVVSQQLEKVLEPPQTIQYQKHMTQHMVVEIDQSWFASLRHAFLIRHPADVVASYSEKRESVSALDLGFAKQKELYDKALALGDQPPIIDSRDVLKNPERCLRALCIQLGISFDTNMLHWPPGLRESDGVWADHWYNKVKQSTGFEPYTAKTYTLTKEEQLIVDECLPYYQTLYKKRLCVDA